MSKSIFDRIAESKPERKATKKQMDYLHSLQRGCGIPLTQGSISMSQASQLIQDLQELEIKHPDPYDQGFDDRDLPWLFDDETRDW